MPRRDRAVYRCPSCRDAKAFIIETPTATVALMCPYCPTQHAPQCTCSTGGEHAENAGPGRGRCNGIMLARRRNRDMLEGLPPTQWYSFRGDLWYGLSVADLNVQIGAQHDLERASAIKRAMGIERRKAALRDCRWLRDRTIRRAVEVRRDKARLEAHLRTANNDEMRQSVQKSIREADSKLRRLCHLLGMTPDEAAGRVREMPEPEQERLEGPTPSDPGHISTIEELRPKVGRRNRWTAPQAP